MGQGRDLSVLLHAKGLGEEKLRENTMDDKRVLTDSEEIPENLQSWCRSVIGGLHWYARGTRYDISYAVSRVSHTLGHPTRGTYCEGTGTDSWLSAEDSRFLLKRYT